MTRYIYLFVLLAFMGGSSLMAQSYNAFFEIKNQKRTGTTFNFEVHMQADRDSSFLSRGQIYVQFNTDAFGFSAVANGIVTPLHDDLIDDSTAIGPVKIAQYSSRMVDNSSNTFVLNFDAFFNESWHSPVPDPNAHAMVPDTSIALYRVSLALTDTTKCTCLALNGALMAGQQFYFDTSSSTSISPYGVGVLPAELNRFRATEIDPRTIRLDWETLLEYNNDRFVVEKKRDEGEFEVIGEVWGSGTTEMITPYSFLDNTPMGSSNFYRIKQIDFDGQGHYSPVVEYRHEQQLDVLAYPNPTADILHIDIAGTSPEDGYFYSLHDLAGRDIQSGTLTGQGIKDHSLNLQDLPSGTYMLKIEDSYGNFHVQKVSRK